MKHSSNFIDLTGQRFGKWAVIELSPRNSTKLPIKFKCLCDCGKYDNVSAQNLRGGLSTQCRYCNRKTQLRESHGNWKGYELISGTIWHAIKFSAKRRDIEFNVSIDYAWKIFLNQSNKCAISGLDIYFAETCSQHFSGETTASLDRIDNTIGYVEGNIQWLHKDINKLKSDLPQEFLISLCKTIALYNSQAA